MGENKIETDRIPILQRKYCFKSELLGKTWRIQSRCVGLAMVVGASVRQNSKGTENEFSIYFSLDEKLLCLKSKIFILKLTWT